MPKSKSLPFELPKETPLIKFRRSPIDEIRVADMRYRGNRFITARWWTQQENGEWEVEERPNLTLKWKEVERLTRRMAKRNRIKPQSRKQ